MLPSLRLIVVGFLCGFVLMFAGLRLAASLHSVHAGLPIMAAHAATMPLQGRIEPREGQPAPVLYDMRFVTGMPPAPLNSPTSVIDRTFASAVPTDDLQAKEPLRRDLVDALSVPTTATQPEPLVVALASPPTAASEPVPVAPVVTAPLAPVASPPAAITQPASPAPAIAVQTEAPVVAPQTSPEAQVAQPAAAAPQSTASASPMRVAALPQETAPATVAPEPPTAAVIPQADIPDLDLDIARSAATVTAPIEETKPADAAPTEAKPQKAVIARAARKKRVRTVAVRRAVARAAVIQRQQQPVIFNGSAASNRWN
jgi:hypothetical protein